ncbi:hypothetical protein MKS88_003769 [Plasmodium brasilianum]|uniref:Lipoprotein n=2 Tax=Plasmodium (Plasmodium) TaxID=418103 RepID=A0A1D3SMV3_PLAMA|nr:conserved Plasmodium protein, unknown function [Plasmodium malariae]KAI4837299.1 hypothetical protein MKS88_003769 [Plasmodium brasilianum]SCO93181.1 conserved Plasmodium protein, unknown function [Plasmodium malariae]
MKLKLCILFHTLYLFLFSCTCNENFIYEKIKRTVNEAEECSLDDVHFMDSYSEKLYWMWTSNFFRYIGIKTYIYENDTIYEKIKKGNNNLYNILKDDEFFHYNNRDEFISNALIILSNEKTLKKNIDLHISRKKVKFFQELTQEQLMNIFINEKNNLINSFKKLKMFEQFRDVANSKYYYHKKLIENKQESKIDDAILPDIKDKHNNNNNEKKEENANIKRIKNVITFNLDDIPQIKEVYFDYYDRNKWNKYFYFDTNGLEADM